MLSYATMLCIQSDGDQHLGLGRVLVDHGWVVVVEAGREAAACSAKWAGSLCPGPPSLHHWSLRPAQRGPVHYGLGQQKQGWRGSTRGVREGQTGLKSSRQVVRKGHFTLRHTLGMKTRALG